MADTFDTSKPIYKQLIDQFYWKIIRGELKAGEKLPSVRETAVEVGVNPNTVSRTYNEMERAEVVETKRGQGTFVTENQQIIHELKEEMKQIQIKQFVREMEAMGYTAKEMIADLTRYLEEEYHDRG
ncbi:GntR family transcriptional regulator [Alteribacillus iranensis]|uniref:GntR family transcriptional regulator n=1 Tax=Alteribacillus iranensis TaxID=930128 RepID=A0A1I2DM48_9BACI|nr:GntR family transcriptional regulator [Alteribacillus iranensis]SFE81333.1 GntR family transcriptional regulator [Alteribacillus iranensis]